MASMTIEREQNQRTPEEERIRKIEFDRVFNDEELFGWDEGEGEEAKHHPGLVDKYSMLPRYLVVKTFYELKEEAEHASIVGFFGPLMSNKLDLEKTKVKINHNMEIGKEKKVKKQKKKYRKTKLAIKKIRRKIHANF